jgi:hypothetical protein
MAGREFDSLSPLIAAFISYKLGRYNRPRRAGTPKGQTIGMKSKKYLATLIALTSYRVKDQAKLLKIPEKLLGKWRTEKGFKDLIAIHRLELASLD